MTEGRADSSLRFAVCRVLAHWTQLVQKKAASPTVNGNVNLTTLVVSKASGLVLLDNIF